MTKALLKFSESLTVLEMTSKRSGTRMVVGKTTGFRPDDEKFCEAFNLAMDATGLNQNDLCLAAIRHGLPLAVSDRLSQMQKARESFLSQHQQTKGKR